jgi:alpha-beta hydrolase superfamily lysophospholipase
MNEPRPNPASAVSPPLDRLPTRELLRMADGYETSVYVHRPPGCAPAGGEAILYVHGIQSHPGWFYGSAMALADAGHTVYQVTRRGSGDNTLDRGHAESCRQLLDDVDAACEFVRRHSGRRSVHLLGVSWGGKLLTAYATWSGRSAGPVASLTLVSPGIIAKVTIPVRKKLAIAASLMINSRKLFDIPLSDVELFTDNEAMRDYLRGDAFRLHRATGRFLFVSRCIDQRLAGLRADVVAVPTTLILSDWDRIIDNEKTQAVMEKLAGRNLRVIKLPGAHTLEFEPDPAGLYRALVEAVARG